MMAADFDGDGRTDLILRDYINNSKDLQLYMFRSTGSGFTWRLSANGTTAKKTGELWFTGDLDGDGKSDLMKAWSTSVDVHLSTGDELLEGHWITSVTVSGTWMVGDPNGDGRADFTIGRLDKVEVMKSIGTDFASPAQWLGSGAKNTAGSTGVVPADLNGDGKTDVVLLMQITTSHWKAEALVSQGEFSELAESVTAPLGGSTTVTYSPSSAWANTFLPFTLQTVSGVTVNDGRGSQSSFAYSYTGGMWDWGERRFQGFQTATATLPCITGETQCPTRKTTFLQSRRAGYGLQLQVEARTGAGALLGQSVEEYTTNATTPPYTALNAASWSYLYEGANSRRTKTTRTFDAYGNVLQLSRYGDFDVNGDEVTTNQVTGTQYLINLWPAAWSGPRK